MQHGGLVSTVLSGTRYRRGGAVNLWPVRICWVIGVLPCGPYLTETLLCGG